MTRVVDKGKFISSTMWARNFSKYLNMVKEEGELFIVKLFDFSSRFSRYIHFLFLCIAISSFYLKMQK